MNKTYFFACLSSVVAAVIGFGAGHALNRNAKGQAAVSPIAAPVSVAACSPGSESGGASDIADAPPKQEAQVRTASDESGVRILRIPSTRESPDSSYVLFLAELKQQMDEERFARFEDVIRRSRVLRRPTGDVFSAALSSLQIDRSPIAHLDQAKEDELYVQLSGILTEGELSRFETFQRTLAAQKTVSAWLGDKSVLPPPQRTLDQMYEVIVEEGKKHPLPVFNDTETPRERAAQVGAVWQAINRGIGERLAPILTQGQLDSLIQYLELNAKILQLRIEATPRSAYVRIEPPRR